MKEIPGFQTIEIFSHVRQSLAETWNSSTWM